MGKVIRVSDLDLSEDNIGQVTPATVSYKRLEYITSTGTQFIDTGVGVKSGLRIVLKMSFATTTNVFGGMDAFSDNVNNNAFAFQRGAATGAEAKNPYMLYGNQVKQIIGNIYNGSHIFDLNDNVWTIKSFSGTQEETWTFTAETFTGSTNIWLFGIDRADVAVSKFEGSVYECQIYDGETLLRDYVAAERNTDSQAGLLDKVNDVFYINDGSGSFTKGPYYN